MRRIQVFYGNRRESGAERSMVGPNGFELEALTRRLSRVPKSRAQRGTWRISGRPEWIRTIDLFRVKEAL